MAVKSIGAGLRATEKPAPIRQEDDMSTEAPTSPQARKSADDCIAEIGELAEFAAGIVADAERLCDRIAELLRRALLCDAQGRASTPRAESEAMR
jgi:hypothetical protein